MKVQSQRESLVFSHLCVELYHSDSLIHNAKDGGEEHEEEEENVDDIPNRPKVTPGRERGRETVQ